MCCKELIRLSPNFSAPKIRDKKQWEKVSYLIKHGFLFQHVYQHSWGGGFAEYPKTLVEAKEFVIRYKRWALKNSS